MQQFMISVCHHNMKSNKILYLILGFTILSTLACKKHHSPTACPTGETYRQVTNSPAIVKQQSDVFFLIEEGSIDTRLKPCNLPKIYQVNDLRVIVSGHVKAVFSPGPGPGFTEPFEITSIRKQ